jgi:uncharacterized protein YjlB
MVFADSHHWSSRGHRSLHAGQHAAVYVEPGHARQHIALGDEDRASMPANTGLSRSHCDGVTRIERISACRIPDAEHSLAAP